jgi:hypothetical protein
MNTLKRLTDSELLTATQELVKTERVTTTAILHHLREVERRKLYADLGCSSLFEYAVRELGYSNSGAGRRIAAMRLMTEIPEVAGKLESGALSLGSVCQAQSYFREMRQTVASAGAEASDIIGNTVEGMPFSIPTLQPQQGLSLEAKRAVLSRLEQKSTREAERILLELSGPRALPPERTRQVTPEHTEVRFVLNAELKAQLETVRSLLGPKGVHLSFAELVAEMACLSAERLAEKKFGKRRVAESQRATPPSEVPSQSLPSTSVLGITSPSTPSAGSAAAAADPDPCHRSIGDEGRCETLAARSRYVSQATRHAVWQRAHARCQCCGTQRNLELEHVKPFALGGTHELNNLQLLCRSCNLRRGVKTFGPHAMRRDHLHADANGMEDGHLS